MTDSEQKRLDLDAKIQAYAKAEADRLYLTEFRKSKKALLMRQAELEGVQALAAQERNAYSHEDYIALLRGLQEATEASVRLRWELKCEEWKIEVWRTRQATARAEMMSI